MELEELLEQLSEGRDLNYEDYPAALVIYTVEGPKVFLNKWPKLTGRLLDQFTIHAVSERERLRRETIKAEKEAKND